MNATTGLRRPIGCIQLQVIFRKDPLIIGLFCGKTPIKIRYPMVSATLHVTVDPRPGKTRPNISSPPDSTVVVFLSVERWGLPCVYSRENLFEILGTLVKSCLKSTGTPEKTCVWNGGSRHYFKSDLLRGWSPPWSQMTIVISHLIANTKSKRLCLDYPRVTIQETLCISSVGGVKWLSNRLFVEIDNDYGAMCW